MEMISEAHVFAEKSGLGSEALESLIQENYGPLALSMSKRLTTGAYAPAPGIYTPPRILEPISNISFRSKANV